MRTAAHAQWDQKQTEHVAIDLYVHIKDGSAASSEYKCSRGAQIAAMVLKGDFPAEKIPFSAFTPSLIEFGPVQYLVWAGGFQVGSGGGGGGGQGKTGRVTIRDIRPAGGDRLQVSLLVSSII